LPRPQIEAEPARQALLRLANVARHEPRIVLDEETVDSRDGLGARKFQPALTIHVQLAELPPAERVQRHLIEAGVCYDHGADGSCAELPCQRYGATAVAISASGLPRTGPFYRLDLALKDGPANCETQAT
jgi:hypothetical protein